jgi:hypothetical protein
MTVYVPKPVGGGVYIGNLTFLRRPIMAKNKVFLTVLALLAGFALFIGCTGETADGSEKEGNKNVGGLVDDGVVISPPETKWEPKIYWTGTIDEDFDGSTVLVVMDKNVGGVNKVHSKNFFGGIEIESIKDLTYFTDTDGIKNLGINWDNWRQLLSIKLPGDSKENVVRAIRHLEKIDGIKAAAPNHLLWPAFIVEGVDE